MPVYFSKYKSVDGTFITVGIKSPSMAPDIAVVETITEEEFLILVETVKIKKAEHVISLDGKL